MGKTNDMDYDYIAIFKAVFKGCEENLDRTIKQMNLSGASHQHCVQVLMSQLQLSLKEADDKVRRVISLK